MKDRNGIKQKIVDTLSAHPEGLPIAAIARLIGADRYTITKYLHELIGAGEVSQRDFTILKINYLTKNLAKNLAGTTVLPEKRKAFSGKPGRGGR